MITNSMKYSMKYSILGAASVLALATAAPAMADTSAGANLSASANMQTERTQNQQAIPSTTTKEMKQGLEKAGEAVVDTTKGIGNAAKEAYEDVKAAVIDEDGSKNTINISTRQTAEGMIGHSIYNNRGEAIGKVHDIILDSDGNAAMVIVADGDLFGLGKKAAFDYEVITNQNADGDFIAPLTEAMIDRATEFSYDVSDASDKVRVMPSGGYSVNALLEGQVVDPQNKKIAEVEDISFEGGKASRLIVGFDQILGLGGKKAAMGYGEARVVRDGDGYDFKLSANQAAQFEAYTKSVN